ncbi:MAG: ABC transporter ATP-binding protein [Firmicutes bacterium]|nr:ABC transporter ATP-binding protein [Bacillota bacterium]
MIKIENLTKRFGSHTALNNFSLTVPKGAIYGLMGLNGAGKTTIIKHLAGLLYQDEGTITIDNQEIINNEPLKERVAIIPDDLYFFRGYGLTQMGTFYKKIYPRWNQPRFEAMISDFGLDAKANIGKFSKGMKKQAAFCLALSSTPDYLILDEPVDGLDPIVRRKLWHYVMDDVADREMTVLISSHNAKEMEDVCNYIGIIAGGRMVFEGDLLEMSTDAPASIEEIFIEKLSQGGDYRA